MTTLAAEQRTDTPSDGRRARRERNRITVVDALLSLYRDGNLVPNAAEIADRAGLSPRSLFRYFDDIDDLTRAAIARQNERVWPLAELQVTPDVAFDERLETFVRRRIELFEAIGWVGRVARLREPFHEVVARQLADGRALLRRQIASLFATELEALGPERSPQVLAALDVLTSYESYRLLRDDQRMSQRRAAEVIRSSMLALLAAADVGATGTTGTRA